MADDASWSNQTTALAQTDDHLGIPDFFGLQNLAVEGAARGNLDGTPVDPDEFVKLDSQQPATPAAARSTGTRRSA